MRKETSDEHVSDLNDELISAIAELLGQEEQDVRNHPDSTFIQLGGDSVRALQLTFQLDSLDLALDLETVLDKDNTLQRLSELLEPEGPDGTPTHNGKEESNLENCKDSQRLDKATPPLTNGDADQKLQNGDQESSFFSSTYLAAATAEASSQIGCPKADIEDVLPITSQQKLLWLGSQQRDGAYIAHWAFGLPSSVDVQRLKTAWLRVLESTAALRARFIIDQDNVIRQAILSGRSCHDLWSEDEKGPKSITSQHGHPLISYGIQTSQSERIFHLYAHHALYDRWSIHLIFDDVRERYGGAARDTPRPSFHPLLQPPPQQKRDDLVEGWRQFIGDTHLTAVPDLGDAAVPGSTNKTLEMTVELHPSKSTKAELVAAAWFWVCSKQSNSADICFGLTIWGRDQPLKGLPDMAFPAFRTLPLCMRLQEGISMKDLLATTKTRLSSLRKLQQLSFDDIGSISQVARQACRFNSIVVVQSERMLPPETNEAEVLRSNDLTMFDLRQGQQLLLECTPEGNKMSICLTHDPQILEPTAAQALLSHFCMALDALSLGDLDSCDEIDLFGEEDAKLIREWTRPCQAPDTSPMYGMVEEQAILSPDSVALWTTTSTMTYKKLMDHASVLARILYERKAAGHIGVCYERSPLAVVAELGVNKAGCAFIPMETTNPVARLQQIVEDSEMTLLICSESMEAKLQKLSVPIMVVDEASMNDYKPSGQQQPLPSSQPTDTSYIIYTSGSTGKPKGVVIQHEQISTSLRAQKEFFNIGPKTRTLQFSSLAFDMSMHEIYMTLSAGGTVCIPTNAERFEPDDFLAKAKVNYSMITPSVFATLSDRSVAQIKEISLCGEALHKGQIERVLSVGSKPWIVYGPSETAIVNLGHEANETTNRFNLGYSFGATAWIVSRENPNRLAPVGIPGELAFSGHTLAAGYYKDSEKTNAAFVEDLRWMKDFPEHNVTRIYLTGDLCRYNMDGSIQFMGRLGGYTKIAGNRVDLDEIQYVLKHECDLHEVSTLICEVGGGGASRPVLLSFFSGPAVKADDVEYCRLMEHDSKTRSKITEVVSTLEQNLPQYMVPSLFIPVNRIPLGTSGKSDAGTLRGLISSLDMESLRTSYAIEQISDEDGTSDVKQEDSSPEMTTLENAWATVLSIPTTKLNAKSHFVRLGGDSLRAMELASALRKSGITLAVADIFKSPLMKDMVEKMQQKSNAPTVDLKPMFAPEEHEKLVGTAAETFHVPHDSIESLSLCSSLQAQLMVASEQAEGSFIHRDCFRIQSEVSLDDINDVCLALVVQNELLRTKMFVDPGSGRFIQAILKTQDVFSLEKRTSTLEQYFDDASTSVLGLGTVLCRFVLLEDPKGHSVLIWEMHHSIYDGHSHVILLNELHSVIEQQREQDEALQATEVEPQEARYHKFVQYLSSVDKEASREFWSQYLDSVEPMSLKILKLTPPNSLTNARMKQDLALDWRKSTFTTATYLRTAFALLLSQYAASTDVNFAATFNGRDLPVDGIEELAGPTFATIPVRVRFEDEEKLETLLSRVQEDSANCSTHQTLPVDDIGQISVACKQACQFNSHLLIQSKEMHLPYESLAESGYELMKDVASMELRIPFNLIATAKDNGTTLEVVYNDAAIDSAQVSLFLDQMSALLQKLVTADETASVSDLFCVGQKNQELIMTVQPDSKTGIQPASTIPELVFRDHAERAGDEALYSSHGSYTYGELYRLSLAFAEQVSAKLQKSRQMVAFCFEKCSEAVIAQLGIMLAGHAFVPIDASWPEDRRKNILQQTNSQLAVTSSVMAGLFADSDVDSLIFNVDNLNTEQHSQLPKSKPQPSDVGYCLFTSGSTGTPKGVVVEHQAISRTLQAYSERLSFTSDTRALLFASFTFDAHIMETWSVLASGGTLCIASDEERIANLSGFIADSKADCIGLTPTAVALLEPQQLPGIKTLLFCGEKTLERHLAPWRDRDTVLVNGYGPTEACVNSATNIDFRNTKLDDIGASLGGGLWIVDPTNVDKILPVGCTGELVISGPVLAREYLNAPEQTAKAFVHPQWPTWTGIDGGRVYKTGDLARLDAEGRLHLIGRNDGQMKINGMRIEAEEIENVINHSVPEVSEVIAGTFTRDENLDELALYFVTGESSGDRDGAAKILPLDSTHPDLIEAMHTAAENNLAPAFVPSIFLPISSIPFTTSGKADRKQLAKSTSLLHPAQLKLFRANEDDGDETPRVSTPKANGISPQQETLSEAEVEMQSMWSTVLRSDSTALKPSSHFIEAGGDSVAAIRLAAVAKSKGFSLPVSVIYANPRLREMATAVEKRADSSTRRTTSIHTPGAFEMIKGMEILSPGAVSSPEWPPQAMKTPEKDYFGKCS